MTDNAPSRDSNDLTLSLRVADLPNRVGITFRMMPDAKSRAKLAEQLGVRKLRKLLFAGSLRPEGRHDWRLEGMLGATAVQDCVITSDPVTTRIDETVVRRYIRQLPAIEDVEVEIPEDDSIEQLPPIIELGEVLIEALALALPDYPRVEGATLDAEALGLDTQDPERRNPFAALAALKDKDD
ncbi:DUF177 domain-containing protein [Pararhodobacter sp.]|uniref:YceD family protein n=1 Tax=Pararhodobacter sp. TaxID=2127056 RepID=UPI002AFE6AE7|nr:DUF177 domain-containing protein [Pararhodobacter sp.]